LEKAKQILKKYELCDFCLGRQFNQGSLRDDELGRKIKESLKFETKGCFICSSLMSKFESLSLKVMEKIKDYEFDTFLVGVSLKPDYLEREDKLRSEFKLKGKENIKSSLGKLLGLEISKLSKKFNFKDPQLTILVYPEEDRIDVRSKSILLYGRYRKWVRGLFQKKRRCYECKGKGCIYCEFKGTLGNSVENILEDKISSKFKAERAKFTWLGGEDTNSLVLGKGRPFFVEVINPKVRKVHLEELLGKGDVEIVELKYVKEIVRGVKFKVKFLARVNFDPEPKEEDIIRVENFFKDREIKVLGSKGERIKKVYELKVKKVNGNYEVLAYMEGGIHIKNFLMGKNTIPNFSKEIGCKVTFNDEEPFDILDVEFS